MKIKMLMTQPGSPDGCTVVRYEQGQHYEVPDPLARVFVKNKWATRAFVPRTKKDKGAAPQNKSRKGTEHGS